MGAGGGACRSPSPSGQWGTAMHTPLSSCMPAEGQGGVVVEGWQPLSPAGVSAQTQGAWRCDSDQGGVDMPQTAALRPPQSSAAGGAKR